MSDVRLPSFVAAESADPSASPRVAAVPATPGLMETVKRFEAAHAQRSIEGMRACFHDDALIESVASYGKPLGADETAEALRAAFNDGVYAIGDWAYEEIAPDTVLSWTGARHRRLGSGMSDETVYRLIMGRDGLMWRVTLFGSRADALADPQPDADGDRGARPAATPAADMKSAAPRDVNPPNRRLPGLRRRA
jgi:hypothetical protein